MKQRFKHRVLEMVSKISKGKVMTYKEVAILSGRKKAFRSVGNILNKNKDSNIPCHRVIRSDNKIGGYNKGLQKKRALLKFEGVLNERW